MLRVGEGEFCHLRGITMSDAAVTHEKETEAPKKKGLSGKLKIGIVLAVVVGAQCVLAWLLLPSGSTADETDPHHASKSSSGVHLDPTLDDPHAERREVDLGRFSITSIDPASNTTLLIDFHLYGAVIAEPQEHATEDAEGHGEGHGHGKKEAGEPEDNSRFGKLLKKNKHRFRDQVIVVIRNAQMSDLSDPALGLIKRQILAKTNSLLGEPLLKEVIFSDFAVVQQ
jgi:flagellar basal body-associated protein FliL